MRSKISKSEKEKIFRPFVITSVCREDFINSQLKYSSKKALKITDEQMLELAKKMESDYVENFFWESLAIVADVIIDEADKKK